MIDDTINIEGFEILITRYDALPELVNEAISKGLPLIGNFSYLKHPPHGYKGDYHIHVYDGNNEIFAINKNGTAHDGYHGVRIPNKVFAALSARFGDWKFPLNQIIEGVHYTYFSQQVTTMTYREVLSEFNVVNNELQLFSNMTGLLVEIDGDITSKETAVRKRFKELFQALSKRIDR